MRIGYDGKWAVHNFTGLGNYSRYVVQSLSAFAPENEYWLYAPVYRENQQLSSMVAESRERYRYIIRLIGSGEE